MKINSYEITDFLRQLALMTKSELPLPSALKQLASESRGRKLKELISELGESASKGKTLSQAMAEHPDTFPDFYVRMTALGEKEGSLANVLSELAQISRFQYMLVNMIRDVMLYPVITIGAAFLILFFISCVVIPGFKQIYDDLLGGEPLPTLTQFVISTAIFIKTYAYEIGAAYIILLIFAFWLFYNSALSNHVLLKLSRYIPFSEIIFYNFGMARLCSVWAVMMRRKVPAEEAFPVIAGLMDFPELENALKNVTKKCSKGENINKCLEAEGDISRLLIMMLENTREEALPDELDKLAELFRERASYGYRRVGMAWEVISIGAMVFIATCVILFLFTPFLSLLRNL